MTRFPIIECRAVPVPDAPPDDRGRFFEPRVHIDAVLDADGNKIRVLTSHYGLTHPEQKCAVAETLRLSQSDMPVVFMGDLNAEPDDLVLSPLFRRLCDTADGVGRAETLTFRSDAPDRRIDYIFVTRDFKTLRMYVPSVIASDHRPAVAEVIL
jgi:endonuclease/exonuclease/phosphatase family metal-dependent hydrolase